MRTGTHLMCLETGQLGQAVDVGYCWSGGVAKAGFEDAGGALRRQRCTCHQHTWWKPFALSGTLEHAMEVLIARVTVSTCCK